MARVKPMLDSIELQKVQKIEIDGDQVLVEHEIPALEGNFFQGTGRRATRVSLTGVLTGSEAAEGLKTLREKFRAADPVPFVADITTATRVDQVLIEEMGVRELAGKPERFEYAFILHEFISAPEPEAATQPVDEQAQQQASETSSEQVDDIVNGVGTLEVQVDIEGEGDYSSVTVVVEGETSNGEQFVTWSDKQVDGIYRFSDIQARTYTVRLELQ